MIFVDTSAFFALADRGDAHHLLAKEIFEKLNAGGEELATHNYVFLEVISLMHRRLGLATTRQFYRDLPRLCRMLWVTQSQHERATKAYVHQDDSRYSLVDCVSFEMMRAHGIHRYFAFDEDFRRPGLESA